jgi:hypothetical protein
MTCLIKSTYFEARGQSPREWEIIASIAKNRSTLYNSKRTFSSRSKNLCDIVKSPEYGTGGYLNQPIREQELYNKLAKIIKESTYKSNFLYFSHRNKRLIAHE